MSWTVATYALLALALGVGLAWYERQHPSARVLAAVATLAALAALGRMAFAPLPDVKPTTAIVVLAGYALGGAPGFAIGAFAAVASNVFFGQGPWTPWQMLGWGLAGVIGALVARAAGGRPLGRVPLALACGAAALLFNLLLDFSTWITYTGDLTWRRFAVIETAALPFNLTHVVASVGFCLAFGPALVRALTRFRARLDVRWLPVAGATLLLVLALAATASASGASRSAAHYLAGAQNSDGGFGADRGESSAQLYTAWAVIGLGGAEADAAGRARAGHYMLANLSSLQGTGDVERTVLALAAVPASIPATLLHQLTHAQSADGSFSDQVNLTAFGVLALRAAGRARSDAAVVHAGRWLASQENVDGGFDFAGRGGGASDVDDTGGALQALAAAGEPTARAAAFLVAAQNPDGGFAMSPGGESDAQSTAWAVQGLIAAGRNVAQLRHDGSRTPQAYLASLAASDGSIQYSRTSSQTPVWVTGQALAALAGRALPIRASAPPRATPRRVALAGSVATAQPTVRRAAVERAPELAASTALSAASLAPVIGGAEAALLALHAL